jgi:acid phosphatase family membrane protein YuiD
VKKVLEIENDASKSIIVMYDATGVRRHAGIQAQVLNRLSKDFTQLLMEIRQEKINPPRAGIKLKEILGHQPIEVFTGAWLGICIAFITYWVWPK